MTFLNISILFCVENILFGNLVQSASCFANWSGPMISDRFVFRVLYIFFNTPKA